eukprot:maker-scaffold_40-snap-gene-0.3-mRNA-1 protein AED:0.03 eAED:0.03 QI:195/0.5/0.33/1/0.5/0.33/3/0/668
MRALHSSLTRKLAKDSFVSGLHSAKTFPRNLTRQSILYRSDSIEAEAHLKELSTEIDSMKKLMNKHDDMLTQILVHLQQSNSTNSVPEESSSPDAHKKIPTKNPRGFIEVHRHAEPYRPAKQRSRDWSEINLTKTSSLSPDNILERQEQASRCMDCGTPFCQTHSGCPINNLIPEWNELVVDNQFEAAYHRLAKTNNFPEFTGRVCPAPCEGACVAGLIDESVTIKNIEYQIIDTAFENGWVKKREVTKRTGKKVAVIGSGPAGLACADQLNQSGHKVTVFEREDQIGGLMYYGIPNMKIDKRQVQRRVNLLDEEGVEFKSGVTVDQSNGKEIYDDYDAVVVCAGSTVPRGLGSMKGAGAKGIHFAMEYLTANQKNLELDPETGKWTDKENPADGYISAEGKDVVVIGGGDTGTDCIGTALRQYCKSLVNLELLPKNPNSRDQKLNPWPLYPKVYKMDYGHEESASLFGEDPREYAVSTEEILTDDEGKVTGVKTVHVAKDPQGSLVPVPNSENILPADLVLLAMGFTGPEAPLLDAFGLDKDARGNVDAAYGKYQTSKEKVFAAGDCRRGQSLVVWAINEGRGAADAVNQYLNLLSCLFSKDSFIETLTFPKNYLKLTETVRSVQKTKLYHLFRKNNYKINNIKLRAITKHPTKTALETYLSSGSYL